MHAHGVPKEDAASGRRLQRWPHLRDYRCRPYASSTVPSALTLRQGAGQHFAFMLFEFFRLQAGPPSYRGPAD